MNKQDMKDLWEGMEKWKGVASIAGLVICVIVSVVLLEKMSNLMTTSTLDDSDNHVTKKRSGVIPVTDNLTGCQYLRTAGGGIVPRMNVDGKQICNKEN